MRVLLTTCSYQDTPGPHHALMESQGWDIVRERGPLSEARMLELAGDFDAFLCGDDGITRAVIEKSLPRLKVISKYGIGLDKIDIPATKELKVPVLFTPGVNHDTVAEHTFLLLLGIAEKFPLRHRRHPRRARGTATPAASSSPNASASSAWAGSARKWRRRARAFGMEVHRLRKLTGRRKFAAEYPDHPPRHAGLALRLGGHHQPALQSQRADAPLHQRGPHQPPARRRRGSSTPAAANSSTRPPSSPRLIPANSPDTPPTCSTRNRRPPTTRCSTIPNVIITPHIGSRTFESVPRQAMKSLTNLINALKGEGECNCANGVI